MRVRVRVRVRVKELELGARARVAARAKGFELARRPEFERDVTAALGTAQSEWRQRLLDELARAVDVWVDDALQLTATAAVPTTDPTATDTTG